MSPRAAVREFMEMAVPVARWEMCPLMRGWRAPVILFLGSVLAAAVGCAVLRLGVAGANALTPEALARVGHRLFVAVTLLETGVGLVLVPLLAGSSLAREFHRQTMDDLLLTRLSGRAIALGKLCAALGLLALVQASALPIVALTFLFGGVSPGELFWAQALPLALAASLGALAIECAARVRHSASAATLTVLLSLLWLALLAPIAVLGTIMIGLFGLLSPLAHLNGRGCLLPLHALGILVTGLLLLGVMFTSPFVATLTHPVFVFWQLFDHQALAWFARGMPWLSAVWWLPPLVLTVSLCAGTRFVLDHAGRVLRPERAEDGQPESPRA